jgi:hypothetical protein
VPILAPITTPIAWRNVIALVFTKAMVMIITTDEESKRMVTISPEIIPLKTLLVKWSKKYLSLSPATWLNPSDRLFKAYKKRQGLRQSANGMHQLSLILSFLLPIFYH